MQLWTNCDLNKYEGTNSTGSVALTTVLQNEILSVEFEMAMTTFTVITIDIFAKQAGSPKVRFFFQAQIIFQI
jgi:hypothetical protein